MTKPEGNIVSAPFKMWSVLCTSETFSLRNTFIWYILLMTYNYATQFAEIVSDTRTPEHRTQLDNCESFLSDAPCDITAHFSEHSVQTDNKNK